VGGANLYTYSLSSPTNLVDPRGEVAIAIPALAFIGAATATGICVASGVCDTAANALADLLGSAGAAAASAGEACMSAMSGDEGEEGEDDPPGPPPLPPRVDLRDTTETVGVPSTPIPPGGDPNDPQPTGFFERAVLAVSGAARVAARLFGGG